MRFKNNTKYRKEYLFIYNNEICSKDENYSINQKNNVKTYY